MLGTLARMKAVLLRKGLPVAVAVPVVSAILPWPLIFNPVSVSGEGMVSLETNAALTTSVDTFSMAS